MDPAEVRLAVDFFSGTLRIMFVAICWRNPVFDLYDCAREGNAQRMRRAVVFRGNGTKRRGYISVPPAA
jgi:hypothetical protein